MDTSWALKYVLNPCPFVTKSYEPTARSCEGHDRFGNVAVGRKDAIEKLEYYV